MKIPYIFLAGLASMLLSVSQNSFAARMTVYNETGKTAEVTAFYSNKNSSASATIAPGKSSVFNSGVHAFTMLAWYVIDSNGNKIGFHAQIPSSRTMLTGKITLTSTGSVMINFDGRGASNKSFGISARKNWASPTQTTTNNKISSDSDYLLPRGFATYMGGNILR
jgi:hypothetical protein